MSLPCCSRIGELIKRRFYGMLFHACAALAGSRRHLAPVVAEAAGPANGAAAAASAADVPVYDPSGEGEERDVTWGLKTSRPPVKALATVFAATLAAAEQLNAATGDKDRSPMLGVPEIFTLLSRLVDAAVETGAFPAGGPLPMSQVVIRHLLRHCGQQLLDRYGERATTLLAAVADKFLPAFIVMPPGRRILLAGEYTAAYLGVQLPGMPPGYVLHRKLYDKRGIVKLLPPDMSAAIDAPMTRMSCLRLSGSASRTEARFCVPWAAESCPLPPCRGDCLCICILYRGSIELRCGLETSSRSTCTQWIGQVKQVQFRRARVLLVA